jgi:glycosyltransferase involved in cell wall biosynthesis
MQPDGPIRTVSIVLNARVYAADGQYFGDMPNLLDLLLELRRQAGRLVLCVPVVEASTAPRWTSALPAELEIVPLPAYRDNVELIRRSWKLLPNLVATIATLVPKWDAVGGVAPSGFGLMTVLVALLRRRRVFLLVRGNVLLSLWGEYRGSLLRRLGVTAALLPFEGITRLLIRRGVETFTFGPALADRYPGPRVHVLAGYARPPVAGRAAPEPVADRALLGRLLYVGRLTGEKGPDVLVRAVALLAGRGLDVSVTCVGDGAERETLTLLADQLGLGTGVRFIPYIGEAERLREQYLAAGIVVIPSRTEGVPGVLLEAMALGRVVVASDVGGIPSLIKTGETGILVPPGDPAALAHALAAVIEDPVMATRLSSAALRTGRERTVEREAALILRHVL